jgi:hypothetical protein
MSYFLDFGDFDLSYLVDLHMRTGKDEASDINCARIAKVAGMRAVLLRSTHGSTVAHAERVGQSANGLIVMGAYAAGSGDALNFALVEAAVEEGAKLVSLSDHAALFDADGALQSEITSILEIVRDKGTILFTGDLSEEKTLRMVHAALQVGVSKILIPAKHLLKITQADLINDSVFFEWTLSGLRYPADPLQMASMADGIRQAGVDKSVISSGLAPDGSIDPIDALSHYLAALTAQRLSVRDLKQMAKKVPAFLLDLPERVTRKPDK